METKNINIFRQMSAGFKNTFRIWMREFQLIFSDVGVMILIFAVPLLYPLLYSFIYYPEVVRDLPIAVVDLSHSSDSRQFTRDLDATPDLKVATSSISMEEAITMFKNRKIRGIVQIPETFSQDIAMKRQTTISAYADMEFFLYYKALMTGASFVSLEAGNQIQMKNLMDNGLTEHQAQITAEPFKMVDNAMANRAGGFASYGIPAALILIIQQTLIIAIGILAGTARERHIFGTLVPMDRKKMGTFRLVVGKAAAYLTSVYGLREQLQQFGPDLILYQAGADTHVDDPLGGLLTSAEMRERDHAMFSIARELAVPLSWNLAGGYQVEQDGTIPRVVELHLNTFEEALRVWGLVA